MIMNAPSPARAFTAADYKSDLKPVWCPGCGDYAVLSSITKALAEIGRPPEEVALISGIGCSSRIPAYTSVYGDGFSIGGNHFVHACRRNVDMTYIVMDNSVYGMTKGQASPTTEPDWTGSKLTPEGPGVAELQPLEIALSAGANFIARGFAGKPNHVAELICQGVATPGFSLIQVLSPCVTFRPEQRGYKDQVHQDWETAATDRKDAFMRLMDDDGYTTGVLFKGQNRVFTPAHSASTTVSDLEKAFSL
jgi:2-oxoglutarate ferredoxin oxidoreductase subunit beta